MAQDLQKQLETAYGNEVKVEFIDTKKTGLNEHPKIAQIANMGYNFPIVAINGQPRLAGGVDFKAIQGIIDEIG